MARSDEVPTAAQCTRLTELRTCRRDFPVEHACTYDHDVERATWFGLYREQFQSRWNNLA